MDTGVSAFFLNYFWLAFCTTEECEFKDSNTSYAKALQIAIEGEQSSC
jgi:hypothetical protein